MSVREAAEALSRGGLVVYPTETVYGIAGDALDTEVVEEVFETKRRPRSEPISMAVWSIESALEYTHPSNDALELMHDFLPGPVTPIVPKSDEVPDVLTAGSDYVGVRIPDDELALELLASFEPITSTSANISGRPSARRVEEVDDEVLERVDAVLDGGETRYGQGSTVVDTSTWEVVREGALADEVSGWIEANVDANADV